MTEGQFKIAQNLMNSAIDKVADHSNEFEVKKQTQGDPKGSMENPLITFYDVYGKDLGGTSDLTGQLQ